MPMQRSMLLALTAMLLGCPGPAADSPSLDQIRSALRADFLTLDQDRDNRLSREEAMGGVEGMTRGQFDLIDTSDDGFIDWREGGLSSAPETACECGDGCSCSGTPCTCVNGEPAEAIQYTYAVLDTFPHDDEAFTQGLVMHEGILYEGTGLYGRSNLRRVTLATGDVEQQRNLPAVYFGEGITVWEDTILQLTWRGRKGFIYDRETFEPEGEFTYESEGWGITHDGSQLIMSDGTNRIRFLDPDTFEVTREILVADDGTAVQKLNELEYINGEIWANVWQTDTIARIDPDTGRVRGWVDLSGLLTPEQASRAGVLNGIAYDAINERVIVTGKVWPLMFHIDVFPAS